MARPLRIHPPGGYHHVTARGNDRLPIFLDDEDRWSFLRLLAEARERFGCDFHAYCLMTNHVHLVIEDHEGNLSKALRHIKGVHAQRFNRRHDRVGHLFEGRFWNSLLGDDAYLTTAVEYVHRNPVDAGIVESAVEYPWSSFPAYMDRSIPPTCLTLGTVLEMHGGRASLERRTNGPTSTSESLRQFRPDRMSPVLGSEEFCRQAIASAEVTSETLASALRGVPRRTCTSLESVRHAVASEWDVELSTLSVGVRGSKNLPRAVAVHLAREAGLPLADIANFFGLTSPKAVSTALSRFVKQLGEDPELRSRVDVLQSKVEVAET